MEKDCQRAAFIERVAFNGCDAGRDRDGAYVVAIERIVPDDGHRQAIDQAGDGNRPAAGISRDLDRAVSGRESKLGLRCCGQH